MHSIHAVRITLLYTVTLVRGDDGCTLSVSELGDSREKKPLGKKQQYVVFYLSHS